MTPEPTTEPSADGIAEALSYAACHGIIVRSRDGQTLTHAPFTYWPSRIPRACYTEAIRLTTALNLLVRAIARDRAFLRRVLVGTAAADASFTGRLLALAEAQPHREDDHDLTICRFDYFVQEKQLRMVEMNTIAASFACLGAKTAAMHRHLATHPASSADYAAQGATTDHLPSPELPSPPVALARAIAVAHESHLRAYASHIGGTPVATVMVVQPGERNAFDQDALRHTLWTNHKVHMKRLSLHEIDVQASVDGSGHLILGETHISVVYLRAGYTPTDYPSESEWRARALLEKSNASVCPTAAVQLAGTKKVQQVLDQPHELEHFIQDGRLAAAIRATFARQYSLNESDGGGEHARLGIEDANNFVLKPQREGGGNNLYSDEMRIALLKMSAEERSAFVLMERIRPAVVDNALVRDGKYAMAGVVSELGVYGALVVAGGDVVLNEAAGTLLRSKSALQDDGGVAAGVAVLDSACLVE